MVRWFNSTSISRKDKSDFVLQSVHQNKLSYVFKPLYMTFYIPPYTIIYHVFQPLTGCDAASNRIFKFGHIVGDQKVAQQNFINTTFVDFSFLTFFIFVAVFR